MQRIFPLFVLALAAAACSAPDPVPADSGGTAAPLSAAASAPAARSRVDRRVIATDGAPAAIGPYSQAIQAGETLYLAGQIGLDPVTGELVPGGVEAEARQVMANLGAVLEAAGFDFADVVQTQIFLTDLGAFAAVNAIYGEFFTADPPARATVGVATLPRGAAVEIMMTAVR